MSARAGRWSRWRGLLCVVMVLGALASAGCGDDGPRVPEQVSIHDGNEQCGPLGKVLGRKLSVQVLTRQEKGLLGGEGARHPVKGVKVLFRLVAPARGAALASPDDSGGAAEQACAVTDGGGVAGVFLRLGDQPGEVEVEVSLPEHARAAPARFRAAGGIVREGDGQEARAGSLLEKPIAVALAGPDGKPLAGVPVRFHVEQGPKGTRVTTPEAVTDLAGRAETQVLAGDGSGQVIVAASVSDPARGLYYQAVRFKLFALDVLNIGVVVIGGLAIFVMGMKFMGDGLIHVAGARMKAVLQAVTHNRFVGILVGTAVTGVIQSSSATTVMVIGFVNAGLLSLERAIGLIMGANIGTTVTAQMISFKLESLALPAIVLGVAVQLLAKRKLIQHWGEVLAGFGLLFFGIITMSSVLKGLEHSPTITGFFASVDCSPRGEGGMMPLWQPLVAVGIGMLVTIIIQSSSASIGLLQVLASTGLVNYYTAVPLLLGCNIGTTTTAIFASIGTNRNARRAAVAHLLFNSVGTVIMYGLFFIPWEGRPCYLQLVNAVTGGDAYAGENLSRHIANAHTVFNVVCTFLFLPFVGTLAWMCRKLVPETAQEKEEKPRYLEPHLLNTPPLALDRARSELVYMTRLARRAISENYAAFSAGALPSRESMDRREERIDALQHDITEYLVKLSQRELDEADSAQLPLLIHAVNDAERIGDHAENLLELAERRVERKLPFTEEAGRELNELDGEVEAMFGHVLDALEKGEPGAVDRALRCETRINELARELGRNHVARLEKGGCNLVSGVVFLDMVANLEKVGDHLTNIAEAAERIQAAGGGAVRA